MSKIIATLDEINRHLTTEADGSYSAVYDSYHLKTAFQPIHQMNGDLFGFEALVRVFNECGDELNTEPFFAPEYYDETDQVNMDRLARVIHVKNFAQFFTSYALFINMVPDALLIHSKNVPAALLHQRLTALGLKSEQVFFELLEHDCTSNIELLDILQQMRAQGMKVALDDYGVKASSECRARFLRPDIIKVDRSLLADFLSGQESPLRKVMGLGRELGAKLLIEGVENAAGLKVARMLNADYIQGFYLGRPQLLSEILLSRVS